MFLATNFNSDQEVDDYGLDKMVEDFERVMQKIMPGIPDDLIVIRQSVMKIVCTKIKAGKISIKDMEKNELLKIVTSTTPRGFMY